MSTLQKDLEAELRRIPEYVLAGLLKRKLVSANIKLSSADQEKLLKALVAGKDNVRFRSWQWWEERSFTLKFTPADLAEIDVAVQRIIEQLPEILDSAIKAAIPDILRSLNRSWPKEWRRQSREADDFCNRLEKRWGLALAHLRMLLTVAREYGQDVATAIRSEDVQVKTPYLNDVLTRLHARACQITHEILALLASGFADGAIARWRTLHEVAVVALFVGKHGEQAAERYTLHQSVESRAAARGYQQHWQRLGLEPLPDVDLDKIEQTYQSVFARFGQNFCSHYGWAAEYLGVARPTFAQIEQAVDIDHLRPYYRMASYNVHANPRGLFFKLGLLDESDLLLAGGSNAGLADPGHNAAVSLVQACSPLMFLRPSFDGMVTMRTLLTIERETGRAFEAAHRQLLRDAR